MSSRPLAERSRPDCPRCLAETSRRITPTCCIERVPLESIVHEAVTLVEKHSVTPFDAADWTASKYNYPDVEIVLQVLREVLARE